MIDDSNCSINIQSYEEMHDEWHNKIDEAKECIEKALKLVSEIQPSISKAISLWGEKGIQTEDGKIVKMDVLGHSSFRERCQIVQHLISFILKELSEDSSI